MVNTSNQIGVFLNRFRSIQADYKLQFRCYAMIDNRLYFNTCCDELLSKAQNLANEFKSNKTFPKVAIFIDAITDGVCLEDYIRRLINSTYEFLGEHSKESIEKEFIGSIYILVGYSLHSGIEISPEILSRIEVCEEVTLGNLRNYIISNTDTDFSKVTLSFNIVKELYSRAISKKYNLFHGIKDGDYKINLCKVIDKGDTENDKVNKVVSIAMLTYFHYAYISVESDMGGYYAITPTELTLSIIPILLREHFSDIQSIILRNLASMDIVKQKISEYLDSIEDTNGDEAFTIYKDLVNFMVDQVESHIDIAEYILNWNIG